MTATVAMNPIPGTSVPTLSFTSAKETSESALFLLYISKILSDGNLVQVKPLAFANPESYQAKEAIVAQDLVVGIAANGKQINLKVHENVASRISGSAKVQLVSGDKEYEVGSVFKKLTQDSESYKSTLGLYSFYLNLVAKAKQNQGH